jgi:hypothetical protein
MSIVSQVSADFSGFIPFVWQKLAAFAAEKKAGEGLAAAYLFELQANLDLLDALNTKALKDIRINDPVFRGLIDNLHTEVAASILFSPDRKDYGRFLTLLKGHFSRNDFRAEAENPGTEQAETVADVLDAMSFSVRKVETLRGLVRFADPNSALFPDYRLAVRLGNISMSFRLLFKCVNSIQKKPKLDP